MNKTMDGRYEGGWRNVQSECMLCEMEKRTEWYFETPRWVVAEKLSAGAFIVSKKHQKELSDEQRDEAERMVRLAGFSDFEIDVRMGMVPDHWHGHVRLKGGEVDFSGE